MDFYLFVAIVIALLFVSFPVAIAVGAGVVLGTLYPVQTLSLLALYAFAMFLFRR